MAISKPPNATPPNMSPFALKEEQFRLCNYQQVLRDARTNGGNVAALRGAIDANNRSGGYFSDPIFKSYLEALLMRRGDPLKPRFRTPSRSLRRPGERPGLADGTVSMVRSPSGVRTRPSTAEAFLKAIDIARSQESAHARTGVATDLARLQGRSAQILARC